MVVQDHHFKSRPRLPRYRSSRDGKLHPDYNRPNSIRWGTLRRACRSVDDADVVVLDGHFALHDPVLRRAMALRVFVDCPAAERLRRRLRRGEPGWTRGRHRLYWRECVQPGHRRFVEPTRRFADLVIPNGPDPAPKWRALERVRRRIGALARR